MQTRRRASGTDPRKCPPRARRPIFCFFMEHSSRIFMLFGVSAKRGEAQAARDSALHEVMRLVPADA